MDGTGYNHVMGTKVDSERYVLHILFTMYNMKMRVDGELLGNREPTR
jgi:hypothetical protein